MVCSSLFASKYNIILSNAYSLCTRTEASFQTFPFHANTRHDLMPYFFVVATMVNIHLGMEVLNMFNSCMDTSGPFVIPFIASLQDIVGIDWKLNIQTRINSYPSCSPQFLSELPQKKQLELMSCLVIVTQRCQVIGTTHFPSAGCKYTTWTLDFVTNQPNCLFHIVLSSKQWRHFINCTVQGIRVAITYARKHNNCVSFNLEQISC